MPLATYPNPPRTTVSGSYLVLLRVGFTLPVRYRTGGVLLPTPFHLTSFLAVSFLLHFPWTYAPQALPGTLSFGARTFLQDLGSQRLSSQLDLQSLACLLRQITRKR